MVFPSMNSAIELTALNLNLKCPSISVMLINKFLTVIFSGGGIGQEVLYMTTDYMSLRKEKGTN